MAEDLTATFALELDGTQAARGAKSTADALQSMRDQLAGGIDELRGMQTALRNLKGSAGTSGDAIAGLKAKIAAQKATIAESQQAVIKLGGGFKQIKAPAQGATNAMGGLLSRVKESRGPLGGLASAFGEISTLTRGAVIAAGIIGITAALVALGAAAVGAAGGLAMYALRTADARRSELLQLEGLTKIRSFLFGLGGGYGRAADSAGFLQDQIDRVSGSVAIGRERVSQYAQQLYRMGLRAGNLQDALEGVSITAATQGEGQAAIFASWAAGAAATGQSVKALANDVKARLGGIAKAQLLSLDVQTKKLHENVAMLFSGLKIEGILKGIGGLTELLSQSTVSGQELKRIVTVLGNSLGGMFEGPALLAKRFFQGMILATQQLVIWYLKARLALKGVFGNADFLKGMNAQKAAVLAGKIAVGLLGVALLTTAGVLISILPLVYSLAVGLASAAASALVLAAPFLAGAAAIAALAAAGYQAYKLWKEMDWGIIGRGIVKGLVAGIVGVSNWFRDTMMSLAHRGIAAFKGVFGIHSPSAVMARFGEQIVVGNVHGIRREAPRATFAMRDMAQQQIGGYAGAAQQIGGYAAASAGPSIVAATPREAPSRGPMVGTLNLTINAPSGATTDIKEAVLQALNQAFDAARVQAAQPLRAGALG